MSMMNLNSVGFKVVAITISLLSLFAVALLLTFNHFEKEKIISQELKQSQYMLGVAETIQESISDKWKNSVITPQKLRESVQADNGRPVHDRILEAVPLFAVRQVLIAKAKNTHYRFKISRVGARNNANEADAIEQQALQQLEASPINTEYTFFDSSREEFCVFRAVKLTSDCEACHGDPSKSEALWGNKEGKDILGF